MDNKIEEKKRQFNITIPLTDYPRTMRFNRFSLEQSKTFLVLNFGFVSEQGTLLDIYSCAIAKEDLIVSRDGTLKYLERLGGLGKDEPEQWIAPSDRRGIDLVRLIMSSHNGTNAEIVLATFAQTALASKTKTSEISAQPIALLGCDAILQRQVLTRIYTEL